MKEARSEHIHNTASAISDGLAKRPMGWQLTTYLWTAGARKIRSAIGVSVNPGHTALIRIPLLAFSSAAVFVRPNHSMFARTVGCYPGGTDQA